MYLLILKAFQNYWSAESFLFTISLLLSIIILLCDYLFLIFFFFKSKDFKE